MSIKDQARKALNLLKKNSTRILVVIGCLSGASLLLALAYLITPTQIKLSFSPETCVSKPVLSSFRDSISRQDFTLLIKNQSANKQGKVLCIRPEKSTPPGVYRLDVPVLGQPTIKRQIHLTVPDYPTAKFVSDDNLPISKPVQVELSQPDQLNNYLIKYQDNSADCQPKKKILLCQISNFGLEQGKEYELSIQRNFKGSADKEVASKSITILEPVRVINRSIEMDTTVYNRPDSLELEFDKELSNAKIELVSLKDGQQTTIASSTELSTPHKLIVRFNPDDIPREASIELRTTGLEAVDGSVVDQPVLVKFSTSGGPKVQSVNIGTHDVSTNQIVINFDQELEANQNIANLIKVNGLESTIRITDSRIIISIINLGKCSAFDINISSGLSSKHGIKSTESWKYNSRTRCYEVRQIGTSVQGRPINAYFFGNGSNTILYTGAIHGNELSSKYIMDDWISELSNNPDKIPSNKQIVVVPVVNPDSTAVAKRYNANNINLNRNFPTANWVSNIQVAGGNTEQGAGGSSALSEPESTALANFTRQLSPSFVVTYHSAGSIVNSNDAGNSVSIGREYARLARYRFVANAETNAVFGLEMSGTYEDWLAEIGIPAILLEMPNNTGKFFTSNKSAIWMTTQ